MLALGALQVVNASVYVVGESPSYQSRLLGIKRQLLQLWLEGALPDGIDVRRETQRCCGSVGRDCSLHT